MADQPASVVGTAAAPADATALKASLNTAVAGVQRLAVEAKAGTVVIDSATGTKLQQALQDHMDQVAQWKQSASGLASALPLGQNWVGEGMSAKVAGRADGGQNSLSSVLDQYHTALSDAKDAVALSMQNYQTTEHAVVTALNQINHGDLNQGSLWSQIGSEHSGPGRAQ